MDKEKNGKTKKGKVKDGMMKTDKTKGSGHPVPKLARLEMKDEHKNNAGGKTDREGKKVGQGKKEHTHNKGKKASRKK